MHETRYINRRLYLFLTFLTNLDKTSDSVAAKYASLMQREEQTAVTKCYDKATDKFA